MSLFSVFVISLFKYLFRFRLLTIYSNAAFPGPDSSSLCVTWQRSWGVRVRQTATNKTGISHCFLNAPPPPPAYPHKPPHPPNSEAAVADAGDAEAAQPAAAESPEQHRNCAHGHELQCKISSWRGRHEQADGILMVGAPAMALWNDWQLTQSLTQLNGGETAADWLYWILIHPT